jgi:hypothetical protein
MGPPGTDLRRDGSVADGGLVYERLSRELGSGGIEPAQVQSGGEALGRVFKGLNEQLRAIPGRGLGYGLLRYLNGVTGARLRVGAEAQIGFNRIFFFVRCVTNCLRGF